MPNKLIGTGANQVPVNGMLGELAFQSKENVNFTGGTGKLSKLDIDEINATIGVTARRVFVYDTSKDSDGGAWRKRCQHTSWYNEQLNTSTRGSRREFPAVAVIVVEQYTITIYDADSADLQMWMVFKERNNNGTNGKLRAEGNNNFFDVYMLNGVMSVTGYLYNEVRFVSDAGLWIEEGWNATWSGISNRNNNVGLVYPSYFDTRKIVGNNTWGCAMTILPDAPIDSATGLQIPTIAISTGLGVTVLHNDNTTANITSTDNNVSTTRIWFQDGKLAYHNYPHYSITYVPIPTVNTVMGTMYNGEFRYSTYDSVTGPNIIGHAEPINIATPMTSDEFAAASTKGITLVKRNSPYASDGMGADITTSYNSGWMVGAIRGAWLSDASSEKIIGSNIVSNSDFSSGTGGWSGYGGTITTSGGRLLATASGTGLYGPYAMVINTVPGKQYYIQADVETTNANGNLHLQISGIGTRMASAVFIGAGSKTLADTFVATSTTHSIEVLEYGSHAAGSTFYVDNVYAKIADSDRSCYGFGMAVNGSLTKTTVASNADLVAYSGFTTSDYLEQPYNSSLDFGTGDFSISGWVSMTSIGTLNRVFTRGTVQAGWSGASIAVIVDSDGSLKCLVTANGYTTNSVVSSSILLTADKWYHFVCMRKSSTLFVYINGILCGIAASTENLTQVNAVSRIGLSVGTTALQAASQCSFALFRVSGTAPSPQMIYKMYNDEKNLFSDNAKCVLYGTSNNVTGIAFDQDTELLHVGTSSGRSVFQNLCRMSNTTTAVSASISAAGALVAEQ